MKNNIFKISAIIVAALMYSCSESSTSFYTFRVDDFNRPGNDSIMALVETSGSPIHLKGEVELEEGLCHVVLINSNSDTVYNRVFNTVGRVKVNEEFDRLIGYWKFYYWLESFEGSSPAGSIDLTLSYTD